MRIFLALLAFLPTAVLSEGARQEFVCLVTLACDGQGLCTPSDREASFGLSPVDLAADGRGTVVLVQDGQSVVAWQQSDLGPWIWSQDDNDLETLMISGPDTMLWHRLTAKDGGTSEVLFLTCEVKG